MSVGALLPGHFTKVPYIKLCFIQSYLCARFCTRFSKWTQNVGIMLVCRSKVFRSKLYWFGL